jgi:hypothetical protein
MKLIGYGKINASKIKYVGQIIAQAYTKRNQQASLQILICISTENI